VTLSAQGALPSPAQIIPPADGFEAAICLAILGLMNAIPRGLNRQIGDLVVGRR